MPRSGPVRARRAATATIHDIDPSGAPAARRRRRQGRRASLPWSTASGVRCERSTKRSGWLLVPDVAVAAAGPARRRRPRGRRRRALHSWALDDSGAGIDRHRAAGSTRTTPGQHEPHPAVTLHRNPHGKHQVGAAALRLPRSIRRLAVAWPRHGAGSRVPRHSSSGVPHGSLVFTICWPSVLSRMMANHCGCVAMTREAS